MLKSLGPSVKRYVPLSNIGARTFRSEYLKAPSSLDGSAAQSKE